MRAAALACVTAAACGVFAAAAIAAQGRYLERDEFLEQSFEGRVPEPESLWITDELKQPIEGLLGHAFASLRVRYWHDDGRSAWVLDEIGKERPITFGVAVENGAIAQLRVLEFRETRGWEIRYPFFTDQFHGARLDGREHIDRDIDGITGATLSVDAARRVARLALFLHEQVREDS